MRIAARPRANRGPTVTPYEYLRKYRNLTVNLISGGAVPGIDVHEYRNAQDVFDKRNTDKDPTNDVDNISADHDAGPGWYTAWPALRGKIAKHGTKIGPNRYTLKLPIAAAGAPSPAVPVTLTVNTAELAQAFTGKATPEVIADVLRLAVAFGLVAGNLGALQSYCDEYIGLDCNGFVGNYLRQEGTTLVGPTTPAKPNDFLPEARRLTRLDDIRAKSVLCWKTAGHVAIVDFVYGKVLVGPKFDTEVLRCMVCESTGARAVAKDAHTDGLNYTLYEIHPPDKHKVFKVKRGLGGSRLNEVYMGNLI